MFRKFQDPIYGELTLQGPVWKMSATPPRLKWLCRPVGADNEYIYNLKLGLGPEQLTKMKEKGIV